MIALYTYLWEMVLGVPAEAASGTNEALSDPFSANFQTAATAGRQTCPSHGHSGNGG
jgi:hypothetical protein